MSALHATLKATPAEALATLPQMGRVMVVARAGGATHERIGPVAEVQAEGGVIHLTGDCHAATIDPAPVARIAIDRSSVMRDKHFSRLAFEDAEGGTLFAVVCMEGLEPFDAAIAGFAQEEAEGPVAQETGKKADLAEDDPVHAPFAAVIAAQAGMRVTARTPALVQHWQGQVEAVKPAMGFLNVMTPDFHLHLSGGSVTDWVAEPGRRIALGPDGSPTGLVVESEVFA